jgi:hypothetical protein
LYIFPAKRRASNKSGATFFNPVPSLLQRDSGSFFGPTGIPPPVSESVSEVFEGSFNPVNS